MAKSLKYWATLLAGIGALNWGLDAFGYNIVEMWLPQFATYVYYAVGASGVVLLMDVFGK